MIVNILIDRFICNYYNLIKENASQREGRRGRGRPARWRRGISLIILTKLIPI
jgi:hypothetical protein